MRRAPSRAGFSIALVKAACIDADAARPQRVLRQIERETICVVQRERGLAVEHVAHLERLARLIEDREAAHQRLAKARLLELERLGDQRLRADEFGIGLAHLLHQHWHEPPHQRLLRAEQFGVSHAAPHDAAEHITAPFVRGQHAVRDQERRRAQMVGDDAMRGFLRAAPPTPWSVRRWCSMIARNRSME